MLFWPKVYGFDTKEKTTAFLINPLFRKIVKQCTFNTLFYIFRVLLILLTCIYSDFDLADVRIKHFNQLKLWI